MASIGQRAPADRARKHKSRPVGAHDNVSQMNGIACTFETTGTAARPQRKQASYKNHQSDHAQAPGKPGMLDLGSTDTPGQFRFHYEPHHARGRRNLQESRQEDKPQGRRVHQMQENLERRAKEKTEQDHKRWERQRYHPHTDSTHFVGPSMMANPPTPSVLAPPARSGVMSAHERAATEMRRRENEQKQQQQRPVRRQSRKAKGHVHPWSHRAEAYVAPIDGGVDGCVCGCVCVSKRAREGGPGER